MSCKMQRLGKSGSYRHELRRRERCQLGLAVMRLHCVQIILEPSCEITRHSCQLDRFVFWAC